MTQTELVLWVIFGVSVVALVVLQVRSMLAAARIGGRSSRIVIGLRSFVVVALLALFAYVVYVQVTR
ncbi:MAG: hypothetical protein Kow0056_08470 [Coriobacteriia bacterium]